MKELDAFTHAMSSSVATVEKIDRYNKGKGVRKADLTIELVTTAIYELERKQKEILTGSLVGAKCANPDDPSAKGSWDFSAAATR